MKIDKIVIVGKDTMRHFRLKWKNMALVVRVSDAGFVERAVHLLDLAVEISDTAGSVPPDITAFQQGTEYVLQTSRKIWKTEKKHDFLVYFITLISAHFLLNCTETVLHASAIVVNEEAVLLSGEARTGKSALCLTAWQQGFHVIGDDWIILDSSKGEVQIFPKPLKPRLPDLKMPQELQDLHMPSRDYLVGSLNGEFRLVLGRRLKNMVPSDVSYPIRNLFLIERGARTECLPASRDTVLKTMLEQVKSRHSSPLRILPFLERLWKKEQVYRLIVGENDLQGGFEFMAGRRSGLI
ncbi:hypothetical protein ACFL27_17345 [candidate division CSSED10-310 bacterium]|uniref:HPr kinase/phosphorylase C-terminal domain-containing protein n=1 Tax=candidate division CSSED10-310 bacterium TaxID=2855610 RepID=A0ABV6Z0J6_UNCC1